MDTGCTNHTTSTLSYFVDIQYGNFGIYNNISRLVKFENIKIIQILIQGSDNKPTMLKLSSVKYYLFIGAFNLISVSQFFKKGLRPTINQDSIL
jgi:hypothetical protein